jgi:DNA-directed RNA polymerase specialized sigma24 family protein
MAGPADSSGSLPPADDAGPASHRDLLVSPKLRETLAGVARRQGVEGAAVEDVVQETLHRALEQRLPEDRTEAKKYVHGIARRVALDIVRGAASSGIESFDDAEPDADSEYDDEGASHGAASAQPARFDDRDEAYKVIAAAEQRFPRSFAYFMKARVLGHTAEEIANDHDVHAGNVRHMIMEVERFVSDYRTRLGASVAVVLLVLTGWAVWRNDPSKSWALLTPNPRTEPPPLERDAQIDDLRARALRACNTRAFAACLADTEAADALDPIGAPSWKSLLKEAKQGLMVHESPVDWDKPPGPDDKKPGRP